MSPIFDVPATAPADASEPAWTVGNVTEISAGVPDAAPLIEHVVSDTEPWIVIVPSAARALSDAMPKRPPATRTSVERRSFMFDNSNKIERSKLRSVSHRF